MFENYFDELLKIRRQIHSQPELGFKEYKTSKYIYEYLKDIGITDIKRDIAKTGVVAVIHGNKPGKTIGLRADMDGLPIHEKTGSSYSSKSEGVMHACGHDGHIAMLLVAAKILFDKRNSIKGNIKIIFQPAEEMLGGGKAMVEENVLRDPEVDMILGLHLWMDFNTGEIGIKAGPVMAAMDKFEILLKGQESHGAMPHQGKDAIVCASELVLALQTIISREVDPLEPAVITIGEFKGGSSYNVLANCVELKGTFRTFNEDIRRLISEKINTRTKLIAESYGIDADVKIENLYPVTKNDPKTINFIRKTLKNIKVKKVLKNIEIKNFERPFMSSEDLSYYLQEVPGALIFIGAKNSSLEFPLHHSKFNFDEKAMLTGLEVLVESTMTFLL